MDINVLVIIVLCFLFFKICDGYNKGMVRQVISFISLVFLCLVILLIGNGLNNYQSGKMVNVFVMILLLAVLGVVHYFINAVFFSAKIIAKIPIIKSVDQLLGVVVGVLETVLILWTIYSFTMIMDLGSIGEFIMKNTADNEMLTWFYENNYLSKWIQMLGAELNEKMNMTF